MASRISTSLRRYLSRLPSDRYAWLVGFTYALLGFFYIFVSDHVLALFISDPAQITRLQTLKGWAFIVVTCLLLAHLVYHGRERARRAEAAARSSDALFRQMIESTNDGVWVVAVGGRITYVNDTMAQMLGEQPHALLGRDVREFASHHLVQFVKETLPGRPPDDALRFECELHRADGGTICAMISATPLSDALGNLTGTMLMVTDITSRRNAEKAASRSLETQRLLLNELDHRVRNNLSSLASLIDLSRDASGNVQEFAHLMSGRVQAMAKAHGLVGRVLQGDLDIERLLCEMLPGPHRERISCNGPHVRVPATQTISLALVVHELISRSERTGALASPGGRIELRWSAALREDRTLALDLTWQEFNGPQSASRSVDGNGRQAANGEAASDQLVSGMVRSDLRGEIFSTRTPTGWLHHLRMVFDRPLPGQESVPEITTIKPPTLASARR